MAPSIETDCGHHAYTCLVEHDGVERAQIMTGANVSNDSEGEDRHWSSTWR
jgi:hypothetical protein